MPNFVTHIVAVVTRGGLTVETYGATSYTDALEYAETIRRREANVPAWCRYDAVVRTATDSDRAGSEG